MPKPKSDTESRRTRGKGFPVVPLSEAARILKDAGKYGTEHSLSAFAGYMGHSTTNSGAFKQRLAAFVDWDLITRQGDRVTMTDQAKRIALPPDPAKEQQDLLKTFKACEIFMKAYESSAKGIALNPATIGNTAVHNQGVSSKRKDKFASSFVDSALAVGLAEKTDDAKVRLLAEPKAIGAEPEVLEDATPEGRTLGGDRPVDRVHAADRHVVLRQPWPVKGGDILLEVRLDRPLPPAAFGAAQEITQAVEKLVEALGRDGEGEEAASK